MEQQLSRAQEQQLPRAQRLAEKLRENINTFKTKNAKAKTGLETTIESLEAKIDSISESRPSDETNPAIKFEQETKSLSEDMKFRMYVQVFYTDIQVKQKKGIPADLISGIKAILTRNDFKYDAFWEDIENHFDGHYNNVIKDLELKLAQSKGDTNNQELTRQYQELQESFKTLKAEHEALKKHNESLDSELHKANLRIAEIESGQSVNSQLQEEVETLRARNKKLEQGLDQTTIQAAGADQSAKKLELTQVKLQRLEIENDLLKSQTGLLEQTKGALSASQAREGMLKERVAKLEAEVKKLQEAQLDGVIQSAVNESFQVVKKEIKATVNESIMQLPDDILKDFNQSNSSKSPTGDDSQLDTSTTPVTPVSRTPNNHAAGSVSHAPNSNNPAAGLEFIPRTVNANRGGVLGKKTRPRSTSQDESTKGTVTVQMQEKYLKSVTTNEMYKAIMALCPYLNTQPEGEGEEKMLTGLFPECNKPSLALMYIDKIIESGFGRVNNNIDLAKLVYKFFSSAFEIFPTTPKLQDKYQAIRNKETDVPKDTPSLQMVLDELFTKHPKFVEKLGTQNKATLEKLRQPTNGATHNNTGPEPGKK